MLVDSPIFTPAACEGTTTLFQAQYFDEQKAYLTQCGQLYNEANAMAFGKVYCFGPTFRAEKSKTRRHLTEFWMVEPEMAYADLDDVMELAEDLVVSVVGRVLEKRRSELTVTRARRQRSSRRSRRRFRASATTRRSRRCKAKGLPIEWGDDFGGPDETTLSEQYDRPVMVHRYPAAVKAFYMKPRSRARRRGARRRRARAGRLRRDHRRRRARSRISICCCSASRSTTCRRKPSSGTSTCAATAPCRTAASAWASSASSPGSAGSSTCAKRSRTRGCCTGCIRRELGIRHQNTHEDRPDLPRLSEEPRRLRGDARARAAGGSRADAAIRRAPTSSSSTRAPSSTPPSRSRSTRSSRWRSTRRTARASG